MCLAVVCERSVRRRGQRPSAVADDDFSDDDEEGMPLPDWNDPDWGFEDEEVEPEDGDFWFDNDDEENAL
jgi:hypothetical protein